MKELKKIKNEEVFDINIDFDYFLIEEATQENLDAIISINKGNSVNIEFQKNILSNIISDQLIKNKKIAYISNEININKIKNKINSIKEEEASFDDLELLKTKNILNQYIETLSAYPLNSEKSNQEIMFNFLYYKELIKNDNYLIDNFVDSNKEAFEKKDRIINIINESETLLKNIFNNSDIKKITDHPWYGTERFFNPSEKSIIQDKLKKIEEKAKNLNKGFEKVNEKYNLITKKNISEMSEIFELLNKLYNFSEKEMELLLSINRGNKNNVEKLSKLIERNTGNIKEINKKFNINILEKESINTKKINLMIKDNNFQKLKLEELIEIKNLLKNVENSFKSITNANKYLNIKINKESDYIMIAEVLSELKNIENIELFKYKNNNYFSNKFEKKLNEIIKNKKILTDKYFEIDQKISLNSLFKYSKTEILFHIDNFLNYNIFNLFSPKKKSYEIIKNIWKESMNTNKKYIDSVLKEVLLYIENSKNFKENIEYKEFFGDLFKGVETNIKDIKKIKNFYNFIEDISFKSKNIDVENLKNLDYKKLKIIKKEKFEGLEILEDLLINLYIDKSIKIHNYDISFKNKIMNYIYQNETILNSIEKINTNIEFINYLENIVKDKKINLKYLIELLEVFDELKDLENGLLEYQEIKIFKKINLFKDNLIENNFIFNKVFQIINKNSLVFIGYKSQINKILKNVNREEFLKDKEKFDILIENYKNYFLSFKNYLGNKKFEIKNELDEDIFLIKSLMKKINNYTEYTKYYNLKNKLINEGIESIYELFENKKLKKSELIDIINYNTYNYLFKELYEENNEIKSFNSDYYEEKINKFKYLNLLNNKKNKNLLIKKKNNIDYYSNLFFKEEDYDLLIFENYSDEKKLSNFKTPIVNISENQSNFKDFLNFKNNEKIETNEKFKIIINKYLDKYKNIKFVESERKYYNGIISNIELNKSIKIRIDDELYSKSKYAKERELFENKDIYNIWTLNLIFNFEEEINKIIKKISQ